jgi:hypothetical protein
MMNDEIILELRATKLKLAEQAGFDMQRLVAQVRQEEAASAARGAQVLQPLPTSATTTVIRSTFQQIRFTN